MALLVFWKSMERYRQTGVVFPMHEKGDRKALTTHASVNYLGIFLLSFPGKMYAKCLEERWCCEITEPRLIDTQCGFIPGVTIQTKFSLSSNFLRNLGVCQDVYTCFVDLEKAYDWVRREKLWEVLRKCSVDGRMFLPVKSLYSCSEIRIGV